MRTVPRPPLNGFWLTLGFLIPVLTACGGGSSASGSGASSPNIANVDWLVSASAARQAVTESSAPAKSTAQAILEIRAINNDANRVATTDALIFDGAEAPTRVTLSCGNLVCTGSTLDYEIRAGVEDFFDANFGYHVAQIQPVMVHNGVNIMQIRAREDTRTQDQFEVLAYGGWMEYSAFSIDIAYRPSVADQEAIFALPGAFGISPGTDPTFSASRSATWTGAVVGMDYSDQNREHIIQGVAKIDVNYGRAASVGIEFSDLVDLDDASRPTIPDMDWSGIPITDGAFSDGAGGNQISGRFFGSEHEEVAGAFDRNQIIGAFGAIRGTR